MRAGDTHLMEIANNDSNSNNIVNKNIVSSDSSFFGTNFGAGGDKNNDISNINAYLEDFKIEPDDLENLFSMANFNNNNNNLPPSAVKNAPSADIQQQQQHHHHQQQQHQQQHHQQQQQQQHHYNNDRYDVPIQMVSPSSAMEPSAHLFSNGEVGYPDQHFSGQRYCPTGEKGGTLPSQGGQIVRHKRKKTLVSAEHKDDRYWERRKKNNVAAKRSRDARRMKEVQVAVRAGFLERETRNLAAELSNAREENRQLTERLRKYELV